jgi:hypothetical protein
MKLQGGNTVDGVDFSGEPKIEERTFLEGLILPA